MFETTKVRAPYRNLLGWRKHFNESIQVSAANQETTTGEYYQDKHPALRLDYIQACLSQGQDLNKYLAEKVDTAISGIFNDVLQYRQVAEYGKTLLQQSQLLNKTSWGGDRIVNQSRLVGFQVRLLDVTGLEILINEIGLQLSAEQNDVPIFIFHSSKLEPVAELTISTTGNGWAWKKTDQALASMESEQFFGGMFYVCYYQDDIVGQAVNYSNFNWDRGECGGCGLTYYDTWKAINGFFHIYPFYVPSGSFTPGEMFDTDLIMYDNKNSWGLNLKLTVRCNLSGFFAQNTFVFKNLLSLKVAHLILKDMKFSQETNFMQEDLKNMVIRDLEGDKETNALNISQQYDRELKSVNFNMQGINSKCLGCSGEAWKPTVGYV